MSESGPISRLAAGAFAVLVLATGGAFFAAQELKSTPPAVQEVTVFPFFSPNQDGRYDRGRASFILKRADDVTATIVDREGDEVRELVSERSLRARQRLRLAWDGTDDDGKVVPDGTYRVQLRLGKQGRTILLPRNMVKDTTPPPLKVLSIGPERAVGPELLPRVDGRPATVRFQAPGQRKSVVVLRTDVTPARSVFDAPIALRNDQDTWTWDGKDGDGRRVAAGTYVVVLRGRDQAGNVGSSVPEPIRLQYGERFPGKGGITVRYLTAQGPTEPVRAGSQMGVAVDSVGEPYDWRVRRVGQPAVRAEGSGTKSRVVRFTAPKGKSGLYVFEVRTRSRMTSTPFVLQATEPEDVLVVYPMTTWQGRNARDDDGDGRVDTLGAGLPVELRRPFTGDGIPPQVRRHEALLTATLDRQDRLYDATTDIALAKESGPPTPAIAGHKAVIIAGDARWIDGGVARRLRAFVEAGGRVLTVGTGSLRRTVRVTPGVRAIDVTQPTRRDLFGFDVAPTVREPTTLTNTVDDIDLFQGTAGTFGGFTAFEETTGLAGGGRLAAVAATEDGERNVLVAGRVGRGLVIRTGLPEFSQRLASDSELDSFLARAWAVLREGPG